MYSTRPIYRTDGKKLADIYIEPMELRDWLNSELGEFPLFNFWGPKAKVASILLKKKLGFRYLMDVIPLDASLAKGSHGHLTTAVERSPLLITQQQNLIKQEKIDAKNVFQIIFSHLSR